MKKPYTDKELYEAMTAMANGDGTKMKDIERRVKLVVNKAKQEQAERERKARNHRLIEEGAMLEKVAGRSFSGEAELQELANKLAQVSWQQETIINEPTSQDEQDDSQQSLFDDDIDLPY